ncbi:45 kDa calcium-binding protein [Callorhinchus milii]|uniref:45 kDa calcium-binding protein n=1 Tax=Callorhinchus milii TaxID=7868 RepID=V9KUZ6_CALMI|nr:45 kDa calcium-binding protein [Callorhinchus milii]|eukprot:gi/632977022/ref/XP_007905117.1/ PREDICTED: 45 kDa calcium-binding protein [Callorhinchus milii]
MAAVKPALAGCLLLLLCVSALDGRPANISAVRREREKVDVRRDENEILPKEHLNGVKMELDGHLNQGFYQEVFLGKEMEEFEEDSEPLKNRRKLIEIFSKVDANLDKKVSASEMQRWIMQKTEEHFQQAIDENKLHFKAVDPDGDGHVSWDEYRVKFLASKGFNEGEVSEKIKNNKELKIDEETQEVLDNLKDRWFQADEPPADQLLDEDEFLAFLHPEHSRGMLKFMVKEIIRDLDQDGDKKLTLPEFISLPVGTVENQEAQNIDDDWVRERKKEFEQVIDANQDGIVTVEELEEYMDPMNEYNALNEAKQMIAVADENQDHYLQLEEILKYSEYFTGSKLMDYARNVHEEF